MRPYHHAIFWPAFAVVVAFAYFMPAEFKQVKDGIIHAVSDTYHQILDRRYE